MDNRSEDTVPKKNRARVLAGRKRAESFSQPYTDKDGKQWPSFQHFARFHLPDAVVRQAGRSGFAAACAKQGREALHARLQAYWEAHPSGLEQQVFSILDERAIPYRKNQYLFLNRNSFMSVDILLPETRTVIDIRGNQHDPRYYPKQAEWDAQKEAWLREDGYALIVLHQKDAPRFAELLAPCLA